LSALTIAITITYAISIATIVTITLYLLEGDTREQIERTGFVFDERLRRQKF